jgi:hypothetical protein
MPLRTMAKLLSGPFTTFQLKSFIRPMCGVMQISMPPPKPPSASRSPQRGERLQQGESGL